MRAEMQVVISLANCVENFGPFKTAEGRSRKGGDGREEGEQGDQLWRVVHEEQLKPKPGQWLCKWKKWMEEENILCWKN